MSYLLVSFFVHITSYEKSSNVGNTPRISVLWASEFKAPTGFGSEAWGFVQGLMAYPLKLFLYHIGTQPEKMYQQYFSEDRSLLLEQLWCGSPCSAFRHNPRDQVDFLILHAVPPDWNIPLKMCSLCKTARKKIGRAMFETTRLPVRWISILNTTVDEIWVPSHFHMETFSNSGLPKYKLKVIPQPVDMESFEVLPKPQRATVFQECENDFIFLSVFKWEVRKGVDILLRAYMQEFSDNDNVCLALLTRGFDFSVGNIHKRISAFLKLNNLSVQSAPRLIVLDHNQLAFSNLALLYVSADVFVLPTRGEGWGRPIMEAMACGLPVIATNWSGQTEYFNEQVGYPIAVESIVKYAEGIGFEQLYGSELQVSSTSFQDQMWAKPSEESVRKLMRWVYSNPFDAKRKGLDARKHILNNYSPIKVAKIVVRRLLELLG
eukprot:jgi/Galph1/4394/GphlegSOOS_G3085.1